MAIQKAFKMFDPVSQTISLYDCVTGAPLTTEQAATMTECPPLQTEWNEVCVQPPGNTDPTLIESGWCTNSYTVDADGVVEAVGTPQLWSADKSTDLTATHEITDCPSSNLIPVGEACYDDGLEG